MTDTLTAFILGAIAGIGFSTTVWWYTIWKVETRRLNEMKATSTSIALSAVDAVLGKGNETRDKGEEEERK